MTLRRLLAAAAAIVVAAGCAGDDRPSGQARLWITLDRGSDVLFAGPVPAGLTVIQALKREADVETAYGGRFVQAINGHEGSLESGRDWFFYVNGVAADRGAAEYRLRPGEIAWWDFHRWKGERSFSVVVGAFPEPFLHGYDGKRRAAAVRYHRASQRRAAEAIGRRIRATSVAPRTVPRPRGANLFVLMSGGPGRFAGTASSPHGPYTFTFTGDAHRLARNPGLVRFRFEGVP